MGKFSPFVLIRQANSLRLGPWIGPSVSRVNCKRRTHPDDRAVLWRSTGTCDNYGILTGHKQAVLDLHWSRDSKVLFSASADMHLASWDVETGERIRRHPGHEEVINCMDVSKRGEEMLVSGSDDGYIGVSKMRWFR